MHATSRLLALVLAAALASCGQPSQPGEGPPKGQEANAPGDAPAQALTPPDDHSETAMTLHSASTGAAPGDDQPGRLRLLLSEGSPDVSDLDAIEPAAAATLSPAEVQAIDCRPSRAPRATRRSSRCASALSRGRPRARR
jgi:hypothetical protein